MADNIVSLDQLDIKFADFIQNSLGLTQDKVRISYQQKGQISSQIEEDIIYVKVFKESDEREIYKNRKYVYSNQDDNFTVSQTSMRTLVVQIVFYGNNSDFYSTKLNELFYGENARLFFSDNNMALIPDKNIFMNKTYEKINGRWWPRCDLKIFVYNSVTVEENVGVIDDVDIRYYFDGGSIQ